MAFGYPYRVRIWRRAASSPQGLVGFVTLAIPAAIGFALLFVTVPMIGSLLSVEQMIREEPGDVLLIHTGCRDLSVDVEVFPDEYETTRFIDQEPVVEMIRPGIAVDLNAQDDPECSRIELELLSSGAGQPVLYDCMQCDAEVLDAGVDRLLVVLNANAGLLRFEWPSLYRYSHKGRGVANRFVGPQAVVTTLLVRHTDGKMMPPGDFRKFPESETLLGVTVNGPEGYRTSDAVENYQRMYSSSAVYWANWDKEDTKSLALVFANVTFRTDGYDAKTNYVLIAGGSAIGLGLTLLVESLIGMLFRMERAILGKAQTRSTATDNAVVSPVPDPEAPEDDEPPDGEDADSV